MSDSLEILLWIPALPLLAAIVLGLLGPGLLRHHSHWVALAAVGGAAVASLSLLWQVAAFETPAGGGGVESWRTVYSWIDSGGGPHDAPLAIDVTLRADPLTAVMLVMVTVIAVLVVLFAAGYMHGDRSYWRFFAYVSLFVFSMTMLVTVSNYLLMFVFWEAVGVCSYLLIGFWYEKPSAAAAGMKAFLVNRIGDFGFAVALLLMWTYYGTLNFHDTDGMPGILGQLRLSHEVTFVTGGIGLAICLLLFLAACGKSAQFPLHVWLPDAMEGPTPVSALIHAATMVTAGVYLITRSAPLFAPFPMAQLVVAAIGGGTALLAALIALTQNDLKRVLAYSTISQLGYMFLALGTGTAAGIVAGMFHLFTHAFFKALLFLGSGSVMHAMGNVIDMRRFGGLRRIMPITHATFAVGCLALSGVFPFAGFFSKDAILAAVHDRGGAPLVMAHSYTILFWLALVTASLTAFYTFRAFFLTFYGQLRIPDEAEGHAHESPRSMVIPLLVLALGSLVVGFLGVNPDTGLNRLLANTPSLAMISAAEGGHAGHHGTSHSLIAFYSLLAASIGIGLAAFLYLGPRDEIDAVGGLLRMDWLEQTSDLRWLDAIAHRLRVPLVTRWADQVGLGWLAQALGTIITLLVGVVLSPLLLGHYVSPYKLSQAKFFLDELYQWFLVCPILKVAHWVYALDRWIVDGIVNLVGQAPVWLGGWARRVQSGVVPFYGLGMVLGTLLLFVLGVLFVGS